MMNETTARTQGAVRTAATRGAAPQARRHADAQPHPPTVSGVRRGLHHGPRVWQGPATF